MMNKLAATATLTTSCQIVSPLAFVHHEARSWTVDSEEIRLAI